MKRRFTSQSRMRKTTEAKIELANRVIAEYQKDGFRITLRQLYYQFVQRGWLPNKQNEYKNLCKAIATGRDLGLIDWNAIVDRLREAEIPHSFDDGVDALESTADVFQLDLWESQTSRVEVWVEKDALSEVVAQACRDLRVPYVVCRGYMSQTAVYEAAQRLRRHLLGKSSHWRVPQAPIILHIGDHDPSGMQMSEDNVRRLKKYMTYGALDRHAVERHFEFTRIALNYDQIEELDPPPNPAKKADPRAKDYIEEYGETSWEVDALPPDYLINLIREAVKARMDIKKFETMRKQEKEIAQQLKGMARNYDEIVENL